MKTCQLFCQQHCYFCPGILLIIIAMEMLFCCSELSITCNVKVVSSLKVMSLLREESLLNNVVFEANEEEVEQWKNSSGLKRNFSIA